MVEGAVALPQIRALIDQPATYGYRRVTAVLEKAQRSEQGLPRCNYKRVYQGRRLAPAVVTVGHWHRRRWCGCCASAHSGALLVAQCPEDGEVFDVHFRSP